MFLSPDFRQRVLCVSLRLELMTAKARLLPARANPGVDFPQQPALALREDFSDSHGRILGRRGSGGYGWEGIIGFLNGFTTTRLYFKRSFGTNQPIAQTKRQIIS